MSLLEHNSQRPSSTHVRDRGSYRQERVCLFTLYVWLVMLRAWSSTPKCVTDVGYALCSHTMSYLRINTFLRPSREWFSGDIVHSWRLDCVLRSYTEMAGWLWDTTKIDCLRIQEDLYGRSLLRSEMRPAPVGNHEFLISSSYQYDSWLVQSHNCSRAAVHHIYSYAV